MNNLKKKFHSLPKIIQFVFSLIVSFVGIISLFSAGAFVEWVLDKMGFLAPIWNRSLSPFGALAVFIVFCALILIDDWWNNSD